MTAELPQLIKPEEYTFTGPEGQEYKYILSNFDAITGRRIAAQYPMSGLPKIGDYEINERTYLLIMSHVEAVRNGQRIRLVTPELIKNHVPDFEVGAKIEGSMMVKNFSFFRDGRLQGFFETLTQLVVGKVSEILILSLEQSSPVEKRPSMNSEPSTTSKTQ